ncbi:uncharacterized protein LOC124284492 [Haliotis rubra]|uniref:uncharacterized protein LOC124284492 n=1 Tax=Haliotis rubra TaxID=36100 RepID=UPI001EE5BB48|nr:uncharacterized protein LOC124284492 [Haliotis rubra]
MALTAVEEEDGAANTNDGEDNQTTIHQNERSCDKLSLFLHDYCGPIPENTISSQRNASCQTAFVQKFSTSTQTDEGFFQAISSQGKPSAPQQTSACTQTDFTQTCEQSRQVLLPSLTFADIKTDPELVNFYTGLGDGNTFSCIFDELSEAYERDYPSSKFGRPNSLSLIDQFFMLLMRLRLGLLVVDIANRFHVSRTTCARTINRWIDLMYKNLSFLISWPKRDIIDATMPKGFKDIYPQTRVVIDCTEIFIEKPYSVARQSQMYSHYKSHITLKGLIGITPNGVVSFVSDLWSGAISDRQITIESGILNLCEFGDAVMADKGFLISDLITPKGLHLIIPPLKRWHKKVNQSAGKRNLQFFLLVNLLHKEALYVPQVPQLLAWGQLSRHQSRKTRPFNQQIQDIWTEYSQGIKTPSKTLILITSLITKK